MGGRDVEGNAVEGNAVEGNAEQDAEKTVLKMDEETK